MLGQMPGRRLAEIGRQWQPIDPAAFAVQGQLAGPPVHLTQIETGDLRRVTSPKTT